MRIGDVRGQVWVETVIYTLIGLAIIGLVLAGALPKINQKKDEMTIGRSIEALSEIDNKIYEVSRAVGSRRVVNLEVRKGVFIINPSPGHESISWVLDSSFPYSEVGMTVPFGNINITTTKNGNYEVELKLSYNMDLRYLGEVEKRFDVAPTPYKLAIENKGRDADPPWGSGKVVIEISEV
jgi:type II secretory pathway pseudopilin PulG